MSEPFSLRQAVRRALVERTGGCRIQHTGWPCNSCFHALELGVSGKTLHDWWHAVLALRGDYTWEMDGWDPLDGRPKVSKKMMMRRFRRLAKKLGVDLTGGR